MDGFNLKISKYMAIIFFVCIAFAIVVMQAYKYLPDNKETAVNAPEIEETIIKPEKKNESKIEDKEISIEKEKMLQQRDEQRKKRLEEMKQKRVQVDKTTKEPLTNEMIEKRRAERLERNKQRPLEPIENLAKNIDKNPKKQTTTADDLLRLAKAEQEKGNYIEAIEEYKKVAETAENPIKAECYEQISTIHAIEKHYTTALAYAQKAYNLAPNINREVLIARLYYKTGNQEKAKNRMTSILEKDFPIK